MTTLAEPRMMKMASGRIVPASKTFGATVLTEKRFLIVLPYWDGDAPQMEELISLLSDLEPERNPIADILLFARKDAKQLTGPIIDKLQAKFRTVGFERCRRYGTGWPFGCNEMAYDLFDLLATTPKYRDGYAAFLPLESDATPTRPGWTGELFSAWKDAFSRGLLAIGYVHDKPRLHVNGVAVWATDTATRVGRRKLLGGSGQIPWDVQHADLLLLPITQETPLIQFQFQRPTITAEQLMATGAAIYHGVKDGSARAAVRATHGIVATPAVKRTARRACLAMRRA